MSNTKEELLNFSKKLNENRDYAFDSENLSNYDLIDGCSNSIGSNGFCVIDNLIPSKEAPSIRKEIIDAQKKSRENIGLIKELVDSKKFNEKELLKNEKIELRSVAREGRPSKPVNDIIWMPKFANYLANEKLVSVVKKILDDHISIVQLHPKVIKVSSNDDKSNISLGSDPFGLPRLYQGPEFARDWHTDWPHDPSAYGGDNPDENIGFIRQPFPDVTMCLVIIFYLNDVDEKTGGTWAVPGSHKDKRTPRGHLDGITLTAPIPGEIQIRAKAGSAFIQDSRLWHSSPLHNFSEFDRVAVVARWSPWWLSGDDFAPKSRYNAVCRPLSQQEFWLLPNELQPIMKHLCKSENNTIQETVLYKSKAAVERTRWAYQQLKENSNGIYKANENIIVDIPTFKKK